MDSDEQVFDLQNTPEYLKTYLGVLNNTLIETIQTGVDSKTRMILLDAVCKKQQQQLEVLNDTVLQMTSGLKSTTDDYNNCNETVKNLTTELDRIKLDFNNKLNEVNSLSSYERLYNEVKNELSVVVNNYNATKTAYEDLLKQFDELTNKYNTIVQKQTSEASLEPVSTTIISKSRKKQKSEDTDWS